MPEFRGLHAVVTGGGRGIGAAAAAALTRMGAHVTVLGRNREALEARVDEGEAHGYAIADVTDRSGLEKALAAVGAARPVDILVNNAGIALSAPFVKTTSEAFAHILETNVMGPAVATRAVLPGMMERKFGRIVNVCSTAALKGYPYVSAYVASKHALLGLTKALALEVAKTGVTVNAVCPSFVDTGMVEDAVKTIADKSGRDEESVRAELMKINPLGRLIAPAEVADVICFLASRASGAINGSAVTVAGGEV